MHRCYVDPSNWDERGARLAADEQHHLLDVLRLKAGSEVVVFDGRGREAVARLVPAKGENGTRARLDVLRMRESVSPCAELILLVALPKGRHMDTIVEKATELGVAAVWPIVTARVVSRPDERRAEERRTRWERLAASAAKQCGRGRLPEIRPVSALAPTIAEAAGSDLFLVGSLAPGAGRLRDALAARREQKPRRLAVLIGPEGDLTPEELEMAVAAGAVPVSFGARTLRVETAAVFAVSVLAYEFLA